MEMVYIHGDLKFHLWLPWTACLGQMVKVNRMVQFFPTCFYLGPGLEFDFYNDVVV